MVPSNTPDVVTPGRVTVAWVELETDTEPLVDVGPAPRVNDPPAEKLAPFKVMVCGEPSGMQTGKTPSRCRFRLLDTVHGELPDVTDRLDTVPGPEPSEATFVGCPPHWSTPVMCSPYVPVGVLPLG